MTRPRIIFSISAMDDVFEKAVDALSEYADVTTADLENYSLKGADIFVGKKMRAEKLSEADNLKAVFAYKTGVDDFPVKELEKRNIVLVNSHANSRYIAEYAFGLAVTLVSRIAEFDRKMRIGDWDNDDPYWKSLFDMKAGLIGYGHIGREICRILDSNDIPAYTVDRGKDYTRVTALPSLEDVCDECDILFLSLPKTEKTDLMFDKKILGRMSGKYIVNVGRSNCLDESALYDALASHTLAGAAIDTWREKPRSPHERFIPFDRPFQTLDNILLSSHKAMQMCDGHSKYVEDICGKIIRYITEGTVTDAVDLSKGY